MDIIDKNVIDDWKKELTVMNQNQSPYVVEVYGYTNDKNVVTIVMEFMARGDLFTLLHKKNEPLSILQRLRMARHCSLGIALLHKHNVIHRDVKSLNILITEDYSCKLTDFGCAKLISDRQLFNTANSGTPLWMAPEVRRGEYGLEADIYSIGLVFYELLERKLPGWDETKACVVLPPQFESFPIVIPCINYQPERRPTAQQVVKALDKLIMDMVEAIKNNIPKTETDKFVPVPHEENSDNLDSDLIALYKYLLNRPADEVDRLVSKCWGALFPKNNQPQSPTVQHRS
uniref:non-specific serine/threonine protein kinase n=1 Tax=Arcella intermedia TaxID=1963864 RepID=A0A6B2LB98_9EUKA